MDRFEIVQLLVARLKKYSWVILIFATLFGILLFLLAGQNVTTYNAKSTVFPLNSTSDINVGSSSISNILGLSDATPKSYSNEASINIVELASSRRTREAVASTRIPSMNNKLIWEILIDENNKYVGLFQNKPIKKVNDSLKMVNVGSELLSYSFFPKINKNGILELYFKNSNQEIVRAVSYVFINKISEFYVELKKKKALIDYVFAVKKADSLKYVLSEYDRKTIRLDESTFFTNEDLKRFNIPKQNLANDKQTISTQYYYALNNRESAAYKLQKVTPIIEILDKPEGPYEETKKSKIVYGTIGLIIGTIIGLLLISLKVIKKLLSHQLDQTLGKIKNVNPTS